MGRGACGGSDPGPAARCNGHFCRIHTNYVRDYAQSEFNLESFPVSWKMNVGRLSGEWGRDGTTFAIILQCARSKSNRRYTTNMSDAIGSGLRHGTL